RLLGTWAIDHSPAVAGETLNKSHPDHQDGDLFSISQKEGFTPAREAFLFTAWLQTPRRESAERWSRCALLLGSSNLSGDFSSEVDLSAFDTFAHFKAGEGQDFSAGFLGQVTDLDFRILDESLLNQTGFSQELVDAALDHVLNDVFRLASDLVGVQRQEDLFFLLDHFRRNLGRIQQLRVAGSHVHGDVARQIGVAAFQGNQYTDAVTVQVGTNHVAFNAGQTTDVDVLATLGNQRFTGRFLVGDQRSCVGITSGKTFFQALVDEGLEVVLQRQEVGLGVDFDDDGRLVVVSNLDSNGAFSGDVAGFLGGLDRTSGTHIVDGFFDIATRCGKRLFAIHHALAGTLTQILDHGCSNL